MNDKVLERSQVLDDNANQIVGVPGHQIALHDLRMTFHRGLKIVECSLDLLRTLGTR